MRSVTSTRGRSNSAIGVTAEAVHPPRCRRPRPAAPPAAAAPGQYPRPPCAWPNCPTRSAPPSVANRHGPGGSDAAGPPAARSARVERRACRQHARVDSGEVAPRRQHVRPPGGGRARWPGLARTARPAPQAGQHRSAAAQSVGGSAAAVTSRSAFGLGGRRRAARRGFADSFTSQRYASSRARASSSGVPLGATPLSSSSPAEAARSQDFGAASSVVRRRSMPSAVAYSSISRSKAAASP